jgi:hypothetical protein
MQKSALDMINDVKTLLSEGLNSPAGQLTTGTGGVQITTEATALDYFNNAASEIARGCYPVRGRGSLAVTAGNFSFPWDAFTVSSGGQLWRADQSGVAYGGSFLQYADQSQLRSYFRSWATDPAATPRYWYFEGNDGIAIYPKPTTDATLTVEGFTVPPPLQNYATVITAATNANPIVITAAGHGLVTGQTVEISGAIGNTAANGVWAVTVTSANTFSIPVTGSGTYTNGGVFSDVSTWLNSDLLNILNYYVAAQIAYKNIQRGDLATRAPIWMAQFNESKMNLLKMLWATDPLLARAHFPEPG